MSSPTFSPTDLVLARRDGPGEQFTIVESRSKRESNSALCQNFAHLRTTSRYKEVQELRRAQYLSETRLVNMEEETLVSHFFFPSGVMKHQGHARAAIEIAVCESTARHQHVLQAR